MVDFNNETTVSVNAFDIMRVVILERRYHLFEAFESYEKVTNGDQDASQELCVVKARLKTMFNELRNMIKRHNKNGELEQIEQDLRSDNIVTLYRAFYTMDEILDAVKLTRIDTQVPYDSTKVTTEDRQKGHG